MIPNEKNGITVITIQSNQWRDPIHIQLWACLPTVTHRYAPGAYKSTPTTQNASRKSSGMDKNK